ncbi:hypothetical protein M0R45_037343 [Rubus argutus]|uniref:MBD domain-containing protein n=1 Tax=Rubus argutus TaxID=59490 RepID=A0AAW1W010_RUBAR
MEHEAQPMHTMTDRLSLFTMAAVMKQRGEHWNLRTPGARSHFFDSISGAPMYNWLDPGWIAEERRMPRGRVYRYYYDPSGFQYDRRSDVLEAYEQMKRQGASTSYAAGASTSYAAGASTSTSYAVGASASTSYDVGASTSTS